MNRFTAKLLTFYIPNKEKRRKKRQKLLGVVKNEDEIIEKNIRFHSAMGVDGFIVTNHNSTDKTLAILEKLKKEGLVLEIFNETSVRHQHNIWVDKMVKVAKYKYHATWVINADADEFYYSKDLDLKVSISKFPKLNAIKVESIFLFPTDCDNIFDNVYFLKNPIEDYHLENLSETDIWMKEFSLKGARTCPKVLHKTKGFKAIAAGNHAVKMRNLCLGNNVDIVLYHYHVVNYRRYAEKAKRWAETGKLLTPGENYLTRITGLLKQNKLRQDYDSKYGPSIKKKLEEMGVISKDYSVINFMKHKGLL